MLHLDRRALLLGLAGAACSKAAAAAAGGTSHTIDIVSDYVNLRMAFEPKLLHIQPGDSVTWLNQADEQHDIISFPDGYPEGAVPLRSPLMHAAGQTWSYRFAVEGTYEYHCLPHLPMGMHGVIVVGRPSTSNEFHRPTSAELADYRRQLQDWFDGDVLYQPRQPRAAAQPDEHGHE